MSYSFLGGLANAYKGYNEGADAEMSRQQLEKDRSQLAEDRAFQAEQRTRQKRVWAEDDDLKDSLRTAIQAMPQIETKAPDPFEVDGGGTVAPSYKFSTQQGYGSEAQAQGARLRAQNMAAQGIYANKGRLKEAGDLRTALTQGDAGELALNEAMKQSQRGDRDDAQKQIEIAKKIELEGLHLGGMYANLGDKPGFLKATNRGEWRPIEDTINITPRKSLVGSVETPSFDWKFDAQNAKGEIKRVEFNSLEFQRSLQPYKDLLKENLDTGKSKREDELSAAHANYYNQAAGLSSAKMSAAMEGGAYGKPYKMDEDDKLKFQAANNAVRDAENSLADSMKNLTQIDDPTKNPAVTYAQKRLKKAQQNQFKTHVDLGQISPVRVAADIMGSAKNNADVMKSLTEVAGSVGADFADKVGYALYENDAYKNMRLPPAQQPSTYSPKNSVRAAGGIPTSGNQAESDIASKGVQAPPTLQQTQEFFRARQQQVAIATEKLKEDPRIHQLITKKDDAIRRGKPVEANKYLAEIGEIKKSYGL